MIELAEVIRELRSELDQAITHAAGQNLRFEVGPIELEVTVAISREASAGGKVKFWVVEADGQGRASSSTTQLIRLTLEPKLVSTGRPPEVSGQAGDQER
ncbi:trypco2 family protein [Streptomyces sp. NPDC004362]|uniref:trypco2 family protein n=1 Tax=Streptomyces sp. NPDC004362 TaxID=3154456 RepID=UPI0033B2AED3